MSGRLLPIDTILLIGYRRYKCTVRSISGFILDTGALVLEIGAEEEQQITRFASMKSAVQGGQEKIHLGRSVVFFDWNVTSEESKGKTKKTYLTVARSRLLLEFASDKQSFFGH